MDGKERRGEVKGGTNREVGWRVKVMDRRGGGRRYNKRTGNCI
jgi:hypothetical protein